MLKWNWYDDLSYGVKDSQVDSVPCVVCMH